MKCMGLRDTESAPSSLPYAADYQKGGGEDEGGAGGSAGGGGDVVKCLFGHLPCCHYAKHDSIIHQLIS